MSISGEDICHVLLGLSALFVVLAKVFGPSKRGVRFISAGGVTFVACLLLVMFGVDK